MTNVPGSDTGDVRRFENRRGREGVIPSTGEIYFDASPPDVLNFYTKNRRKGGHYEDSLQRVYERKDSKKSIDDQPGSLLL
jgi:hypothetical protein